MWIFHTVPRRGEFGSETWENGFVERLQRGVWAAMSADLELGYVYLPAETPATDSTASIAPATTCSLKAWCVSNAQTGKRIWHFQLIHHGLWDSDIPTAPTLVEVTVGGRRSRRSRRSRSRRSPTSSIG